ncbi:porin family protein [Steroidobacter sp. S1-65]|uniref:Porin family protein n=1 Tax=Steroidobacter gossypii TaxID=2805490 RepID=A0ABS1WXI0_9GAMM|nr:porin family protein [Steroidobacter gossypii]MBM0105642.1 porin family protein [Steroidobacter gossypii]
MQKKLAIGAMLAFACVPAMAESEAGFYTGAGVGKVTLEDDSAGVEVEGSDTGFKVFGGYRFNEYASLEIGYIDAGTPDDTVSGVLVEADASAIQASALWQIPISNRFEGYVRAGFLVWESENSFSFGGTTFSEENDGTDFAYGIGAAVHVTPKFGLRAEFEGAELDGTDMRALSIAGLFRF